MTDSEVVDHGEMEGAPDPESEQVVTQNSQPEDGVEDAPTGNDPVIAHGLDQGGSEDAAADLASQYQNTLRAIAALVEPTMRRTALRERLEARPVEEVVWWIDQLLRGSLWGRELEMAAMLACSFLDLFFKPVTLIDLCTFQ